jgi:hypothetical protein
MMDRRRVFIANLSKGSLGEDKSALMGALLVTGFQLAAMSRADLPESDREDFYLYVDEFQNFSTESFASILSEARKYRLCLTVGHQYLGQLPESLQAAVFGNVGTILSFRVSEPDGQVLADEFGDGYLSRHFSDLPNHELLVKLMICGQYGQPFAATSPAPCRARRSWRQNILTRSRQRFGTPRRVVEEKINRWLG